VYPGEFQSSIPILLRFAITLYTIEGPKKFHRGANLRSQFATSRLGGLVV
jgi:hypothetical protein